MRHPPVTPTPPPPPPQPPPPTRQLFLCSLSDRTRCEGSSFPPSFLPPPLNRPSSYFISKLPRPPPRFQSAAASKYLAAAFYGYRRRRLLRLLSMIDAAREILVIKNCRCGGEPRGAGRAAHALLVTFDRRQVPLPPPSPLFSSFSPQNVESRDHLNV